MGIRASDHPALMAAVQRQLDKEKAALPQLPKITWVARTNLLKIKPIVSKDPVYFKTMVEAFQAKFPTIKLYLFEITES